MEEDELPDVTSSSELPIIPNYLANPPFPYVYNSMSSSLPEPPVNGSASHGERQSSASSLLPAAELCVRASARCEDAAPTAGDGALPAVPGGCAGLRCSGAAAQSALFQASWGRAPPSPAGPQQPGAPLGSGSCTGPVPTFQPVFFTGAFPLNMQGNGKSVSPCLSLGFVTLDSEVEELVSHLFTALPELSGFFCVRHWGVV